MSAISELLTGLTVVLAVGQPAASSPDPLLPLHVTPREVPGLTADGSTQACEGGEALTALYDGGYQRYVRAGVVRASRRYYKLRGASVEMVIHQMTDPRATDAFVVELCNGIHAEVQHTKQAKVCMRTMDETSFGFAAATTFVVSASYDKPDGKAFRSLMHASVRHLRRGLAPKAK
jgi:hypothetical protein